MSLVTEQHSMRNPRAALHWYDFLCPFCYIGQSRNAVLVQAWCSSGRTDIPEIHPETPHGGISKKLNVLFIPSSGIPRSRLLDSRRWFDSPSVRTRLCRWRFTFRWPSICLFGNRGSLRNLSILDRVKDPRGSVDTANQLKRQPVAG